MRSCVSKKCFKPVAWILFLFFSFLLKVWDTCLHLYFEKIILHAVMRIDWREQKGYLNHGSREKRKRIKRSQAHRLLFPTYTSLQMKEMSVLEIIFCDVNQRVPCIFGNMVTEGNRGLIQWPDCTFHIVLQFLKLRSS